MAPLRQLPQHGRVQIAIGREGQGPRDRRGGHVEGVGHESLGRLSVERGSLADAKVGVVGRAR